MYCLIFTRGGLPIMMGQHARSESLFYYFKLDEYIPKNHLLRLLLATVPVARLDSSSLRLGLASG
jgi:hypothetical protein